ncbi:MAG TPA: hypothetical protein O0X39_01950 [Methanocorpusculum sp.]|nr:hypothetical protein [Methanocorpusculum sp.]
MNDRIRTILLAVIITAALFFAVGIAIFSPVVGEEKSGNKTFAQDNTSQQSGDNTSKLSQKSKAYLFQNRHYTDDLSQYGINQVFCLKEFGVPNTSITTLSCWLDVSGIDDIYFNWTTQTNILWGSGEKQPYFNITGDGNVCVYVKDRYTEPLWVNGGVATPAPIHGSVPTEDEMLALYTALKNSAEKYGIQDLPVKIMKAAYVENPSLN